jgi:hypothetical protein
MVLTQSCPLPQKSMSSTATPFFHSNKLQLLLDGNANKEAYIEVLHVLSPPTLSAVALVKFKEGRQAALKIFDRRYSPSIRQHEDGTVDLWTPEADRQLKRYIDNGGAARCVRSIYDPKTDKVEVDDAFASAQHEIQYQARSLALCDNESRAYRALQPFQRRQTPYVSARVILHCQSTLPKRNATTSTRADFFHVPALFIEYTTGPTLRHMPTQSITSRIASRFHKSNRQTLGCTTRNPSRSHVQF